MLRMTCTHVTPPRYGDKWGSESGEWDGQVISDEIINIGFEVFIFMRNSVITKQQIVHHDWLQSCLQMLRLNKKIITCLMLQPRIRRSHLAQTQPLFCWQVFCQVGRPGAARRYVQCKSQWAPILTSIAIHNSQARSPSWSFWVLLGSFWVHFFHLWTNYLTNWLTNWHWILQLIGVCFRIQKVSQ